MILAIRTDKPEAELYLYENEQQVDSYTWLAHRQLSESLLQKIDQLLQRNKLGNADLTGIVVFQGPGSFTGLRIGITVANTLAYSLQLPITGDMGDNWLLSAINKLTTQSGPQVVLPEYGSEAHITKPRK